MELDDALYAKIERLSEAGNRHMDLGEFEQAIEKFSEAVDLLPSPQAQWEASTWLYGSIGDAEFARGEYALAKEALLSAMNSPEAMANPFLQLRLGESCHELGELDRAREHLLRAYMLEGEEIFKDEPARYLQYLKDNVKL